MTESRLRAFIAYVEDLPGVLNRVTSLFRRRSYNIGSLTVGRTHEAGVSRMTIVMEADDDGARRIEANLYKLVNVLRVEDTTLRATVARELALIKVRADAISRPSVMQLTSVSRLVSTATGMVVPPNKAVVGANAFAHESGIHQDGMLKHQSTYEIMRPETVGAAQTRLVLGKHSGRAALAARLAELGTPVEGKALDRVFARFKALAERRKHVTDADLEVLVSDERPAEREAFSLEGLQVGCGTMGMATATVRLRRPEGAVSVHAAVGTGPVDAAFKAIDAIVGLPVQLVEFSVHSVTEGIDALGHVNVRVREIAACGGVTAQNDAPQPRVFHGAGADTDIIVASAKAYLRAINRLLAAHAGAAGEQPWQAPARSATLLAERAS